MGDRPSIRLERDAEHQRYFLSDGTQVSGASSIAKMGDSIEGIIYWAWKLGMEGKDYKKVRDSAADSGQIAHFMADCFLKNADPDLREFTEEEIAAAQPSYDKFLDFWSRERLTMVAQEKQMVHEVMRFGGTVDLVALDENGYRVLIDWKTSKAVYNGHKWQLAGYELLWNHNFPLTPIQRRAIIRIGRNADDRFHTHWISDDKSYWHKKVFSAQTVLFNTIKEAQKGNKQNDDSK